MLLRQKDPKGFTVQTLRSKFKTVMKNEDGQLRAKQNIYMHMYSKNSKMLKKLIQCTCKHIRVHC